MYIDGQIYPPTMQLQDEILQLLPIERRKCSQKAKPTPFVHLQPAK
jgi:hypothetical protein